MKKIVLILVLLLVVGGGGIGTLYFLKIGPFAGEEEPPPVEEVGVEPLRFVEIPLMTIPIIAGDRVTTTVMVQLTLETETPENQAEIERIMPRLRDAFLSDLYGFLPRLYDKKDRMDVSILRQRLQIIADREAGDGVIKGVLIQSLNTQSHGGGANR